MRKLHRLTIDTTVDKIERERQWKRQGEQGEQGEWDEFTQVTLRGEGRAYLTMRWGDDCEDPKLGDQFAVTIQEVL